MEKTAISKVKTALKLDFTEEDDIWMTSSRTLRKTIGLLGMALPLLLFVFLCMAQGPCRPLESISHYYYTRVSGIFVAILSILAIFLIIYKGRKFWDFLLSSLAGVAILVVVLFPTSNLSNTCCDPETTYALTRLPISECRENVHYACAAVFLFSLAMMSIFLFTKSDIAPGKRGTRKVIRNRIYRVCGVLMIVAMLVMLLGGYFKWIPEIWYDEHQLTFWMETLAVESFGFSWLVKGETLFKDKNNALSSLPGHQ